MAARAKALAQRVREKGKKSKSFRRAVDSVLSNQDLMAIIPNGAGISKSYTAVKQRQRQVMGVIKAGRSTVVSPCTKKWFTALTSPFSQEAQGACIPSGANISSMRYMNYVRGDIVIGTKGIGYLQLWPTAYNDVSVGAVTDATFTGTTAKIFTAGGSAAWNNGVNPIYFANARFSSADATQPNLNQKVASRLVGGGIKLYYTGTELNMGGLVSVYTNPQHINVNSAQTTSAEFTPTSLGAYQETLIRPITREIFEYPLSPLLEKELSYSTTYNDSVSLVDFNQSVAYPWSQSGYLFNALSSTYGQTNLNIYVANPTTIIMVTGVPGNTIHFELAMHVESVGDLTTGMRQPADSDTVGVDSLMAALSRSQISRNSYPKETAASVLKREMAAVQASRDSRVSL